MIILLLHTLAQADEPPVIAEEPTPIEQVEPIEPIELDVTQPPPVPTMAEVIPSADLPFRGPWAALFLLFLTGLSLSSVGAIRRLGQELRPTGLLPSAITTTIRAVRTLAALAFIGAVIALVPAAYAPALPWMILACAVAVGWSVRDVLPDLVGGVVLRVEGRLARGQRLPAHGVIESVGLLSTTLRDGQTTQTMPNRLLLTEPLVRDEAHWPAVEVWLLLPEAPAASIRLAIADAALTTPWGAPGEMPIIEQDPAQPARWRVSQRIIDARFTSHFRGSLRERVLDRLSAQHPQEASG